MNTSFISLFSLQPDRNRTMIVAKIEVVDFIVRLMIEGWFFLGRVILAVRVLRAVVKCFFWG